MERIPTGIQGFDELIEGGLPKGSITLISGTPGTGKSIFCAQILYANALKGKKCLYLNLEQNEGRLEAQMFQFGWDPEKVKKNLKIVAIDSGIPGWINQVLDYIQAPDSTSYELIALDSLDSISSTPVEPDEVNKMSMGKIIDYVVPTIMDQLAIGRLKLKKIFSAIAKKKVTAIVTSERVEGAQGISRDTMSEFLVDGIVLLKMSALGEGVNRTIEVAKMRQTKMDGSVHSFDFKQNGIIVE